MCAIASTPPTSGTFRFQADVTRISSTGRDAGIGQGYGNRVGLYGTPRYRANFATNWTRGDFGAAVFVDYIGGFEWDGDIRNSAFIRVNPSVSFSGLWDTRLTVGVNNVFDSDPPFDGFDLEGFDTSLYNGMSRFWYLRVERSF